MANLKRKFAKDQVYPFSFEWIIKEETLREDKFSLETPEFDIPNFSDVKYYVTLIPTDNFTLIYLNLTPNNMKITAKCNVLCKPADISITLSPSTASQTWCNDLLDTSKNFIVDKKLVLFITGSFTIENVDEIEAKMAKVDKNLGLMLWESEADKNVSIVIDGENKLKAHECILKRRSPKFAKLLNVKPEPGTPSVEAKIVVENKSFDTVKEAIMYCYDIQNSDALTSENAANILVFAEEYEIHDLKKNMEEFCIENLSVSNACLFANSSITAKSEKLKRECLKFLSNCMKTATAVKDISELNQELKEILFLQSFVTVVEN